MTSETKACNTMRYSVQINGQPHTLAVEADAQGQPVVLLDDRPVPVEAAQVGADRLSLLIEGHSYEAFVRSVPSETPDDTRRYEVLLAGIPYVIDLVDERRRSLSGMARGGHESGEATLKAPMPGLVVDILVQVSDVVERGQRVAILEAMKMQNDLMSPRAGVIRAIRTARGQAVNQGQPLVVIGDPADAPSPAEEE